VQGKIESAFASVSKASEGFSMIIEDQDVSDCLRPETGIGGKHLPRFAFA